MAQRKRNAAPTPDLAGRVKELEAEVHKLNSVHGEVQRNYEKRLQDALIAKTRADKGRDEALRENNQLRDTIRQAELRLARSMGYLRALEDKADPEQPNRAMMADDNGSANTHTSWHHRRGFDADDLPF